MKANFIFYWLVAVIIVVDVIVVVFVVIVVVVVVVVRHLHCFVAAYCEVRSWRES